MFGNHLSVKMRLGNLEPQSLQCSPGGKPCIPGTLNGKVQLYVKAARENGAAVGTRVEMAAADCIITKFTRLKLASNGGHINITETQARSLLRRMIYTQRKGTKGIKHLPDDFEEKKKNYLQKIDNIVTTD